MDDKRPAVCCTEVVLSPFAVACFAMTDQEHRIEIKHKLSVERAKGIEPSYAAWEAAVLPLNYARKT
jgi:hypothetical protein